MRNTLIVMATLAAASVAAEPSPLAACRDIAADTARLACYDQLAGRPSPVGARPATDVHGATGFGFEQRRAPRVPDELRSRIVGLFDGWEPRTRFRLENGQVWQVTDGTRGAYQLQSPGVRITRGVLGNHYLQVDGAAQTIGVKRIE